jgi:uncharacterized zinc-type alcohol dehydrogenase-like protein
MTASTTLERGPTGVGASIINGYTARGSGQPLEIMAYKVGPLGDREVEIKVTHCGICHSDLSMIDNEWHMTRYPIVPGHEIIGTVSAFGRGVRSLAIGQRVGLGWQSGSCGGCEWCASGKEHLCAQEEWTIVGRNGGWADFVRADARFMVPIPNGIASADAAPLMCAGTTVFSPLIHCGVVSTMRAAVVGVGGLGHLAVQFLAKLGCEVTAISSTHSKDEEARQLGASRFIATKNSDELQRAARSFDFILVTVSADMPWRDHLGALRPEGTLCLVGIPESDLKVPPFDIVLPERRVVGGRAGSPGDTARMLHFAAEHGVRPMIESFKMSDLNSALARVREGKVRYRAVLEN